MGLTWSPEARADAEGDAVLAQVDRAAVQRSHGTVVLQLTTRDTRGRETHRTLQVWQDGPDRRLVRITAPPRVAGVALLADHGTVHVYLPAYGRARRVVGEQRQDAFLGTDFSIGELSRTTWSEDYDATLRSREGGLVVLDLQPEPDAEGVQPVTMTVREADHVPVRIAYTGGERAGRTLRFEDVRPVDGLPLAHRVVLEDPGTGRTTVALVEQADFHTPVDPTLFSVARLGDWPP